MCFDTDYDYYYFTSERRKARKVHKCDECRQPIQVGEHYRYSAGSVDGEIDSFKACLRCEAMRAEIKRHEIAEGCAPFESICPDGYLREYLDNVEPERRAAIEAAASPAGLDAEGRE